MAAKRGSSSNVSSASFLDLKAELSKKEHDFKKAKGSSSTAKLSPIVGGVTREEKKTPSWMRPNKGVKDRAKRDLELEEVDSKTIESARMALERKSRMYEKLQRGRTGGLSEKQYETLLVDFDSKADNTNTDEDEESSVDESRDEDPMVEYTDEYGRTRMVPRSEVPRGNARVSPQEIEAESDPYVIHNPMGHFPTYEPSSEKLDAINAAFEEARKDPITHYDASREIRTKGAGFYQFSADEITRQKQMDELRAARDETEAKRGQQGADERDATTLTSRASEKRKRDIEERKLLIQAKRLRRVNNTSGEQLG